MAKRLRDLRVEAPLSIRGLAKLAAVSQVTIQNLETGRSLARPVTMKKIANALGVEIGEVAEFKEAIEANRKGRKRSAT